MRLPPWNATVLISSRLPSWRRPVSPQNFITQLIHLPKFNTTISLPMQKTTKTGKNIFVKSSFWIIIAEVRHSLSQESSVDICVSHLKPALPTPRPCSQGSPDGHYQPRKPGWQTTTLLMNCWFIHKLSSSDEQQCWCKRGERTGHGFASLEQAIQSQKYTCKWRLHLPWVPTSTIGISLVLR